MESDCSNMDGENLVPLVEGSEHDYKNITDGKTQGENCQETKVEKMSKNAIRKKQKWEKIKQAKKETRLKRKNMKKMKNEKQRKIDPLTSQVSVIKGSTQCSKKERIRRQRERLLNILHNGNVVEEGNEKELNLLQICIDLQFSERMSDKELSHLASQLGRVYGANKSNQNPAKLSFVNLDEKGRAFQICRAKSDGFDKYIVHRTAKSLTEEYNSRIHKLVYLTPDSPVPLEELELDKIYVIGGLVDDSVQKNVTMKYAIEHKISTARLPIQEHCSKCGDGKSTFKQILTINQVFDILQKFNECKNWSAALNHGVPHRTGYVNSNETI